MKRNITVNIFGSLYPIDEDAFAMLNSYIINMRGYFLRQPDGKEIADDIEARIAELMAELRKNGVEAISVEHIEEIINRIGSPEQLETETPDSANIPGENQPEEERQSPVRKLYRDPQHKILGGVFVGLGCYLGINPLWLRLAAIILAWPSFGIIIVLYAVCWACIPMAKTPAERLQMKGEPVNLSNLCDEFLDSTREILNSHKEETDGLLKGMQGVVKGLLYAVCILLIALACVAFVGVLISVVCFLAAPWGEMRDILGVDFPILQLYDSNPSSLLWICGVSVLILIGMTLFIAMHFLMRMMGKASELSTPLRVACVVIWLVALIVFAASWTRMISNVSMRYAEPYRSETELRKDREIRQLGYLEKAGWTLVKGNGVDGRYTGWGKHFSDNDDVRYLHGEANEGSMAMEYEVCRNLKVAPGIYDIKAAVRTNGKGAEIYAVNGMRKRYSLPIPVCGAQGGTIWSDARRALDTDTAKIRPDRGMLKRIADANKGKGYGWSEVILKDIVVGKDSVLVYGITNESAAATWEGSWLSACDFETVPHKATGK